jgi:hypothetical protein
LGFPTRMTGAASAGATGGEDDIKGLRTAVAAVEAGRRSRWKECRCEEKLT